MIQYPYMLEMLVFFDNDSLQFVSEDGLNVFETEDGLNLFFDVISESDSIQDEDGNILPKFSSWVEISRCRDEAGNGKKIVSQDGNTHQFSFLVQLPFGVEAIKAGTKIRVRQGDDIRCTGDVIYSRKDQFHSRIWV